MKLFEHFMGMGEISEGISLDEMCGEDHEAEEAEEKEENEEESDE